MELALIGPLYVDQGRISLGPRDRVVLSALAVHPGESMSAGQLADALWHDNPPESWPKVVQGCVMRIRKALGSAVIQTTTTGYRLEPGRLRLDAALFEKLIGEGREQVAAGVPDRAVSSFARALGLWRGQPFEDLADWPPARFEAERLSELRRTVQEDLLEARLESGEHREVAADGMVLVSEEPWRERRWAILALAQYRCGRQADALASIRRARRALGTQLGIDPGSELVKLEAAILAQDPELAATTEQITTTAACPYKGLAVYDVDDSDSFFGRDEDVAACLQRLTTAPVLVLAGPSGSGKSSLLRAGLLPALQAEGRLGVVFMPGRDPASAMAAARASVSGHPILLIDQFEEVFTLGGLEAAKSWLTDLAAYAKDTPVVLGVRADHLAGLAIEPTFARLVEQGLYLVRPLEGDALRAAIEGPAARSGLRLEPGLVDLLVRDTEGEPGALPLLSHALVETWHRREGRVLTVGGYQQTGGIRGAVAGTADRLYESLPEEQRAIVKSVLLRLVTPSDSGEPVPTRVSTSSVSGDPDRARVVDLLVRARLLTTEKDKVELAHVALARAWPRLRSWLDEDAAGQRILRHLSATAEGWEALGRPSSELYQGARLEAALEWRQGAALALTALEEDFLAASSARTTSERQRAIAEARHKARQNRQLRGLLAGAAGLLVLSLVAAAMAVSRGREAGSQRDAATAAQLVAEHESLVNRSLAMRATNRSVAALLAVEAYRQNPDALAHSALLGTFTASPGFVGYEYLPGADHLNGVLVPGTSQAAVALDGSSLRLLNLRTGQLDDRFPSPPDNHAGYSVLRVSADGRYLAELLAVYPKSDTPCGSLDALTFDNGRDCNVLSVYDIESGRRVLGPLTPPVYGGDVAINDDGSLVAVAGGFDGDLATYRVKDGKLLGTLPGIRRPADVFLMRDTAAVVFGRDNVVYLGSMAGPIKAVDPLLMTVRRVYDAPMLSSHNGLSMLSDGTLVANGDNYLVALDVDSGERTWTADIRDGQFPEPCPFFSVAASIGRMYCGTYFGRVQERDLATGERTGHELDPQLGVVGDLAVSDSGRELITFAQNKPVLSRWRLDGSGLVSRLIAPGVMTDGFSPDGHLLPIADRASLGSADEHVKVWDVSTEQTVATPPSGSYGVWLGTDSVLVTPPRGQPQVYDVNSDTVVTTPSIPRSVQAVWPSSDGSIFYVMTRSDTSDLPTWHLDPLDADSLEPAGPRVSVRGYAIDSVSTTADLSRLVVSAAGKRDWLTSVFDSATGSLVARGLRGYSPIKVSPDGVVVADDQTGDITAFNLETLEPVASLPGARANVRTFQFSTGGDLLLVTSPDQTVQVYDVESRARLGDPIDTDSPELPDRSPYLAEGWLRPDGKAIALNSRLGVTVWSIDPATLADAACTLAGRNLTPTEWDTYLSHLGSYRETCPQFPS